MSRVKAAINDLEEYNPFQIQIGGVWIKLAVTDCILLGRAWASNSNTTLHGHYFHLTDRAASGDNAFTFPATDSRGVQHQFGAQNTW